MQEEEIRAIIVDDEDDAINTLVRELNDYCPEIEIVGKANTIKEAYTQIKKKQPQLLFLDIDLGEKTSFELLDLFQEINFQIIFVTGHNEFAIKAIKYSALDYILKPVSGAELVPAIQKVTKVKRGEISFGLLKQQIEEQKIANKIALQIGSNIQLQDVEDILYCKSEGNFTSVVTSTLNMLVSRSLKELDFLLAQHQFYRVHRSFLININHIKTYVATDGGYILMQDKKPIPISKRKKEDFLQLLKYFGSK